MMALVCAGSQAELRGCVNDVKSMYSLLQQCYGFQPANMKCLVDNDPSSIQPTGANIKKHLAQFVAASKPGDVLVFHFSGHGTQVRFLCSCACISRATTTRPALR
jgi:metacaspase-1